MSRTTIWFADADGIMRPGPEFHNAHWGCMSLWKSLAERYGIIEAGSYLMPLSGETQRVWDLARNDAVPYEDRVSLYTTFDYCLVRSRDFREVGRCLVTTARWISHSHLDQQAAELLIHSRGTPVLACGWHQTSVSENPWWVESDDEDDDEGRPYDIHRDTKHFYLDEELPLRGPG